MRANGVFSAEGVDWRPQRRLSMEALSQRHLRGFYPALHQVALRLQKRWMEVARQGLTVDVLADLRRFTVDVTTLLVFGHDANTLGRVDDQLRRHIAVIFPALNRRLFAPFPLWRVLRLPSDRRLDRSLQALRTWLEQIIATARARVAEDLMLAQHPSNFLEAMLTARDDAGKPFSDEVIMGNCLTMLLAGEDTTANTLAWATHHLSMEPHVVEALREEADRVLGKDTVAPDMETAAKLTYAGAVANEAMRLRPVAPFLLLDANQDTVVGDIAVPKGTTLVLLTRLPVMDVRRFDAPHAFRPDRWLQAAPKENAHDASAHIPFGSGPRICPGRSLAMLEMRVVLAALFKDFDVVRSPDAAEVTEEFSFTMSPSAVPVRLVERATQGRVLDASVGL
jgi:cytochrome P450